MKTYRMLQAFAATLVATTLIGCGGDSEYSAVTEGDAHEATVHAEAAGAGHMHGPNGGEAFGLGESGLHAELVIDEDAGEVAVYILGSEGKSASPVSVSAVTISFTHGEESEDFALAASPLEGEEDGTSSKFVSKDGELIEEFHHHSEGAKLHFEHDGAELSTAVHLHSGHGDDDADHKDGDHDSDHKDGDHKGDDDDANHKESGEHQEGEKDNDEKKDGDKPAVEAEAKDAPKEAAPETEEVES